MESANNEAILIFVTAGSNDEAERIANVLVESAVVACVNIIPGITSIFRWQGKIEHAAESLLICKTVPQNFERVKELVQQNHSYDTPEIISVAAAAVENRYLGWLKGAVSA